MAKAKRQPRPEHADADAPDASAIPPGGNQSLRRGLTILALLAEQGDELGVRDIARLANISLSIVHRLVRTLHEQGFVEQSPSTQRYRVGFKAFDVGNSYLRFHHLQSIAAREMAVLANEHRLNAFLGIIQGAAVVYLMTTQSSAPIAVQSSPGTRAPLHSTAIAKAMLAYLPDEAILATLGPGPLTAVTPHTKTNPADVLADIQAARRKGYAVSDQEYVSGVLTVGAAIRDRSGMPVAGISGSVPKHLHKKGDTAMIGKLLIEAAERISAALGAPPR